MRAQEAHTKAKENTGDYEKPDLSTCESLNPFSVRIQHGHI
jgi:hypothetical protein